MRKKLCVIIPVYKAKLTQNEKLSIQTTIEKMKGEDIFFITYQGEHLEEYKKYSDVAFSFFDKKYFSDLKGYNSLMLSLTFYKRFKNYEYMLIVQPDALLFKGKEYLFKLLEQKYDYWGAEWKSGIKLHRFEFGEKYSLLNKDIFLRTFLAGKPQKLFVGNGGLSIRNIKKTQRLLLFYYAAAKTWQVNEDGFFAYYGINNWMKFRVAPPEMARCFSLEVGMHRGLKAGKIPFGVHGWERYYPELLRKEV